MTSESELPRHWKPNDWIRLAALVGGFLMFLVGAWMLYLGIKAEGAVDLKSAMFSGTVRATSAGLYICFFSLFIIGGVLTTLVIPQRSEASAKTRHERLIQVFWALLVGLVVCGSVTAITGSSALSLGIGVIAVALSSVVYSIINS
jgi:hypothetical protein